MNLKKELTTIEQKLGVMPAKDNKIIVSDRATEEQQPPQEGLTPPAPAQGSDPNNLKPDDLLKEDANDF